MKNVTEWSIKMLVLIMMPLLFACGSSDNDDSEGQDLSSNEVEQIIREIDLVSDEVSDLYLQAKDASEMATHLDEIMALEHVETAWAENDAVYATLKNGMTMFWYFTTEGYGDDSTIVATQSNSFFDNSVKALVKTRASGDKPSMTSDMKVCIINQVSRNKGLQYVNDYFSQAAKTFENWGYKVREVNSEEFTPKFIREEMANYEIVLLCTHGLYPRENKVQAINGKHWFATGVELKYLKNQISSEPFAGNVMIGVFDEDRDGKGKKPYKYLTLSENWIKNNLGRFPDNSLMFSTACHSLEGNDNFFKSLEEHNLGCYLGFNYEVPCKFATEYACDMFLSLMILGSTAQGAFDLLDLQYKATLYKGHAVELKLCRRDNKADVSICDAMDLGLSVMWGTRNLGAKTPFELGNFYQWGITDPIGEYEKREYDYTLDFSNEEYYDISGNLLHDPATKELGEGWRLPTMGEIMELVSLTQSYNVKSGKMAFYDKWVSGSMGGQLTISSVKLAEGKSAAIFLPYYWNSSGHYMSGWLIPDTELNAVELMWMDPLSYQYTLNVGIPGTTGEKGKIYTSHVQRSWKCSVRPVYGKKKL